MSKIRFQRSPCFCSYYLKPDMTLTITLPLNMPKNHKSLPPATSKAHNEGVPHKLAQKALCLTRGPQKTLEEQWATLPKSASSAPKPVPSWEHRTSITSHSQPEGAVALDMTPRQEGPLASPSPTTPHRSGMGHLSAQPRARATFSISRCHLGPSTANSSS